MNANRTLVFSLAASLSACSFASTGTADPAASISVEPIAVKSVVMQSVGPFSAPKVGIRLTGGNWNEFMVGGGVDVTFNVPLIPLPALRVDGEIWGKPGNFGADRRGNALSLLGIQTFLLGYAGAGPSYYFTDDQGNHKSGIGLKVLGGLNLPDSCFVEASILIGPSTPPIFFSIGKRF